MYPRQAPLHEILILEAVFLKDEVSRYLRTTYIFIFQTILHWQKNNLNLHIIGPASRLEQIQRWLLVSIFWHI